MTAAVHTLRSASGLWFEFSRHGGLRRAGREGDVLGLFVGHEAEAPPANLWLRTGDGLVPLLGPASPSRVAFDGGLTAHGQAHGLRWRLVLRLAESAPAWFWHVEIENRGPRAASVQLLQVQDIGLAPYGAVRLNEHYVSHYVDLQPLAHSTRGWVVAARQNLAAGGRHPWALMGSLRRAASYATDALQWRDLHAPLPGTRRQHEHAGIALEDAPLVLKPGARAVGGFFGLMEPDHPAASGEADLGWLDAVLALPEAQPAFGPRRGTAPVPTLFSQAPWLQAEALTPAELDALFGTERRHEETEAGQLRSFFAGEQRHVVLPAKEAAVLRPHGHILRSGEGLVPDESALTSTVWMAGVFHSMVTQGHVSINRFLSTVHGYLGQFRAHGQRLFVKTGGAWRQLGVPSAFEIEPDACRWVYKHRGGLFVVHARVLGHRLALALDVRRGPALDLLATHHVALGGDDGSTAGLPRVQPRRGGVLVRPPAGSDLALRFPRGGFAIEPLADTRFDAVTGDERLFADGLSRGEPFVCIEARAVRRFGLAIEGRCIEARVPAEAPLAVPRLLGAPAAAPLADFVPWLTHNALVHYLAPRGLEQYSGGGWGTRDVCQGPLEMLLGYGRTAPVRDLLCRTFANQNDDGDWPQWFMFFERDRAIRAGDSHGDIVFWPLLGLARYLLASGDFALLDEPLPFFGGDIVPLWQHVQRALALIEARRIPGTHLAAYWHGDWNDALQPADPALRERLCSAWTVTLHHQMLRTLADALRTGGRTADAAPLEAGAARVLADFQRLLVNDGVVAGYALFPEGGGAAPERYLLHPSDTTTGLRYSLLPMMHAVLEDMLEPAAARAQLDLIARHLQGPDGARLFDAPMAYRGGPERLFQRAESAAYFGREIGVMYTHAHLRYAEALAHVGDAAGFWRALLQAVPIGLRGRVPSAAPRQANCYYSSSDAAFADRYEAQREYARIAAGTVALEGGWRIYSSGPGIALSLLWRHVIGLELLHDRLVVDPVLPAGLSGIATTVELGGHAFEVQCLAGPAGCGPQRITLGGRPLAFTRRANPHRPGAAELRRADVDAACTAGCNRLVIELG